MVGARPTGQVRRGADKGIDGRLFFHDDSSGKSILFPRLRETTFKQAPKHKSKLQENLFLGLN